MSHNRKERQAQVDAKYEFVVYGGEYSIFNALLIGADVLISKGKFTFEYLNKEATRFGIDLAAGTPLAAEEYLLFLFTHFHFDRCAHAAELFAGNRADFLHGNPQLIARHSRRFGMLRLLGARGLADSCQQGRHQKHPHAIHVLLLIQTDQKKQTSTVPRNRIPCGFRSRALCSRGG